MVHEALQANLESCTIPHCMNHRRIQMPTFIIQMKYTQLLMFGLCLLKNEEQSENNEALNNVYCTNTK